MREVWRSIPGYEGSYEASSLGRIRSLDRHVAVTRGARAGSLSFRHGRVLSPRLSSQGYFTVSLGKCAPRDIHRLVCLAFHGEPSFDRAQAAHRDGIRTNNVPSNLYWATRAQNTADAVRHGTLLGNQSGKLSEAKARLIRRLARDRKFPELARRFGVSRCAIADVVNFRTYRQAGE